MAPASHDVYPQAHGHFTRFASRRSVVHGTKGMVSCTQPLAARAGIKVLDQGGNAADAAVAVAAAMNVTEPCMNGLGGDMFVLFYDNKQKKTRALNGSGRSPAGLSLEALRKKLKIPDDEIGSIPTLSVESATVPGAAAGWVDTVEKFGSGKVSMEQVLAPAIELGEEGYPVSHMTSKLFTEDEEIIKRASPNFAELLKADPSAEKGCRAPLPGELMFNKTLAQTFKEVAKHGKKGFYEGRIAEQYVRVVKDLGGHITLDDLKAHGDKGSPEVEPISIKYSGQGIKDPIELWEHPPNGQGLIALMSLGILQEMEKEGKIKKYGHDDHNSVEYLHALIESLRIGFSDGSYFITDPDSANPTPVKHLLSEKYLKDRASLFSPSESIPKIEHLSPGATSSDTVYHSVTDSEGNAASFIISNYDHFGTAIIPEGCGFTLQNRGANFVLGPPDHPNVYGPGKRPYHTIIPGMVTSANTGELHTCFGVMGGFMQPQGHIQTLFNMLVFGMNPQEALDAPRICIETNPQGVSDVTKDVVYIEEGIPDEVVEGLKKLGHRCKVLHGYARGKFGRGQIIRRNVEDGRLVWSAGSDPRADGCAIPQ